jgi:predicted dienelactone hydrolase
VGLAPAVLPRLLADPEEIYNMSIPIQLQIGSEDGLIRPEDVKAFFNNLASEKKTYIEIKGGNHIRFMDRTAASIIGEYVTRFGTLGKQFKDRKANITFEEQHNISSSNFVKWFDHFLKH